MARQIVCPRCGEVKNHYGKGLCQRCYQKVCRSTPESRKKHADDMREWRKKNPDKAKAIEDRRSKTAKRKEWEAEYNRKYYAEHAEELREYQRQWRKDNPEQRDSYKRDYRRRKHSLPDTLTDDEWQDILQEHYYLCAYCETSTEPLEEDHWIPVSRGGGRTRDNIVPACHMCNSRKGSMTGDEFLDLLDLEELELIEILVWRDTCASL